MDQKNIEKPIISVIVPIYRVEKYIKCCVDSILSQTYKNLEVILVDDGSDDKCPEICDEYAMKDNRVKVIHQKNGGQDAARKAGIKIATGMYVGYVDGDDWIEPTMYEELLKAAVSNDVEVVESGVIDSWVDLEKIRVAYFDEGAYKGKRFSKLIAPQMVYAGVFFRHGISPYLMTKLFKRKIIEKYQMLPESSKNVVDDIMCTYPCIISARSLYITHKSYYHYRVREDSAKRECRNDIAYIVKECFPGWKLRFDEAIASDQIEQQIHYFTAYLLIAKAIFVFDKNDTDYYLEPYGGLERSNKIILYGAGTVGTHLQRYIKGVKDSSLICWVDKNFKHFQVEYDIRDPKEIMLLDFDYIIIAILNETAVKSAKKDLLEMGVPEYKILWIADKYITDPASLLKQATLDGKPLFKEL